MSDKLSNDIEIANEAIKLMITNDWDACEKLLLKNKDQSALVSFCHSFFACAKGLLIFEETELIKAGKLIDKSQKQMKELIKNDLNIEKNIKKTLEKTQDQNDASNLKSRLISIQEEIATKTIMIADCKLFIALLTIVRQDIPAILSTGVFELKRAWKTYSTLQRKFFNLYKAVDPNAEKEYGADTSAIEVDIGGDIDDQSGENSVETGISDLSLDDTAQDSSGWSLRSIKRLLASVSFGYGIVQLCFSFLPPNILKLMKFIGFDGERQIALKALSFTSTSEDIRAPFADLTLLFYSTLGRQLFGYSELEGHLAAPEITRILERNFKKYENSSLFLLIRAKYYQLVEKNQQCAEEDLRNMQNYASKIPELVALTWYEFGMLYLMRLDFKLSLEAIEKFAQTSKWSVSFNSLLLIVLNGALDNQDKVTQLIKQIPKSSQMKNPIELYAQRRIEFIKKASSKTLKTKSFHEFLIVEMLYIFGFLPFCDQKSLDSMLTILDQQAEKNLISIKTLIEAGIQFEKGELDFSQQLLDEAIARDEKQSSISKYVRPYAHYQLSNIYCAQGDLNMAISQLEKCSKFKDYELEDRIQMQIRITKRLVEYKKNQTLR